QNNHPGMILQVTFLSSLSIPLKFFSRLTITNKKHSVLSTASSSHFAWRGSSKKVGLSCRINFIPNGIIHE
ncbi:MAG: hypothetical protein OEW45_14855, partial [Deltaproteobacteria bacterium]|nr:hypothetical protein [Deltaproteobacteria bacterium]